MAVMYNQQNVDEKYSGILEPNLYYDSIFVPGVTFTDKYTEGPAGGIFVHKLSTSPSEVGKPGRDFKDEETKDGLIQIVLNNNFQKSKKIYSVQASAVGFDLANENLSLAIRENKESWQASGLACLVSESKAATSTAALTVDKLKEDIINTRKEITRNKGKADIILASPETYALMLLGAGKEFTPVTNERITTTGNVGQWLGFTIFEVPHLAEPNGKYYNYAGILKTASFANVDYIMYNSQTLSIVNNFETVRLRDSERFVGTLAQVEMNSGYRITNSDLALVRSHTA